MTGKGQSLSKNWGLSEDPGFI